MIRVGVIGCGQWGPNHIRNFNHSGRARVVRCADRDAERLEAMRRLFPDTETTEDADAVTGADDLDAVVIATPPGSHRDLAAAALAAGKDVLCEKPLCPTTAECSELTALADEHERILMVGHVFLFNAGLIALRERLDDGVFGDVRYLHATRTNLGPIRTDVNAAMDLAAHDVSIFNWLLKAQPESASARGACWLSDDVEDVAFVSLRYPGGVLANLHVSWLDPHKVRRLTVVGDKGMAAWDDLNLTAPLTLYDKKVEQVPYYEGYGEFQLRAHEGDVTIPKVHMVEPLRAQTAHFLDCVESRETPVCDGANGRDVVAVLEAVQRSMNDDGAPVAVETGS